MKQKSAPRPAQASSGAARHLVVWLVLLGLVVAIGFWLLREPPGPSVPVATATPAAQADFSPLVGRWQRTDGEYIIEIRSAGADGVLDAKYFNPGPINVGKALGMIEGGRLTALVELRDVNYPGSTYRLRHAGDKLTGDYFQATQGQTFQVEFVRLP